MAYAALQDLINRYGSFEMTNLTDRTGTGSPDADVAGYALSDAGDLIDSYLASRYKLPLDPVPDNVLRWSCVIARFLLWKDGTSDAVKTQYNAVIAELRAAQAGALVLESAAIDTPTVDNAVQVDGPRRVFTHDALRDY